LVDTPGFDDTFIEDTNILGDIAAWLNEGYENSVKLTGIIYLHRIADIKLGYAGMKTLRLFRALCGENGLKSVVLATTHWPKVVTETELKRERQLKGHKSMWKTMIENGCKVWRQDRDEKSALEIIQYLINLNRQFHPQISEEMANGATLDETAAGREMEAEFERIKKDFERQLEETRKELKEANRMRDLERKEEMEDLRAEIESQQEQMAEFEKNLRADANELRKQREDHVLKEKAELEEKIRQQELAIQKEKWRMEQQQQDNEHALKIKDYEYNIAQAQKEKDRYRALWIRERYKCTVM
jgi:hypothetical protein